MNTNPMMIYFGQEFGELGMDSDCLLYTSGHLAKGEALKIGTMNIDKLNVKRIKM